MQKWDLTLAGTFHNPLSTTNDNAMVATQQRQHQQRLRTEQRFIMSFASAIAHAIQFIRMRAESIHILTHVTRTSKHARAVCVYMCVCVCVCSR